MDGSALYGSDDKRAKMLRLYEGGLMKTSQDGSYMPIEKSHAPATHDCSIPSYANQDKRCFAAGNQSYGPLDKKQQLSSPFRHWNFEFECLSSCDAQ